MRITYAKLRQLKPKSGVESLQNPPTVEFASRLTNRTGWLATRGKVRAMQRYRAYYLFAVLGALAVVSIALSGAPLLAATPSPSFTIAATNVTMSSNFATGTGSTSFTLTSVNDYAGNVGIICGGPTVPGRSYGASLQSRRACNLNRRSADRQSDGNGDGGPP